MKFINELNITTNDGTLVGILVLPDHMSLLVTNNQKTQDVVQAPVRQVRRVRKYEHDHSDKKIGRKNGPRGKMFWVAMAKGYRQLPQETILEINALDSLKAAEKLAKAHKASATTGERIWRGIGSYTFVPNKRR